MLRTILGTIAGIAAAMAIVLLVEWIGHLLHPLPADVDMSDPEAVGRAVEAAPFAARLIVVAAWFLGAAGGALVARLVSRRYWSGWVVAAVIAAGGVVTVLMIPHPAWMQVAAVAAPLLGGLVGQHLPLPAGWRPARMEAR